MIRVRFFARLREQLDTDQLELPAGPETATIGAIAGQLRRRGGVWAEALGEDQRVLMSLNQELADQDAAVADGDEVAFFPPVTGG